MQKGFIDPKNNSGSNIFTYKNVKLSQTKSSDITDANLIEELNRLQVKKSITAAPTRECSEGKEILPSSFFHRAELAKIRVKEAGKHVGSSEELSIDVKQMI